MFAISNRCKSEIQILSKKKLQKNQNTRTFRNFDTIRAKTLNFTFQGLFNLQLLLYKFKF